MVITLILNVGHSSCWHYLEIHLRQGTSCLLWSYISQLCSLSGALVNASWQHYKQAKSFRHQMSIIVKRCLDWAKPLWQIGHPFKSTSMLTIIDADLHWRVNQWRHVVDTTQLKLTNLQQHNPTKSSQMPQPVPYQRLPLWLWAIRSDHLISITFTWPITQKVLYLDTRARGRSWL